MKFLYGSSRGAGNAQPINDQTAALDVSSLGYSCALNRNGAVSFNSSKWKITVSPVGIALPDAHLFKTDQLAVVRSPSLEIGFSCNKERGHYFFTYAKQLSSKLILNAQVLKNLYFLLKSHCGCSV